MGLRKKKGEVAEAPEKVRKRVEGGWELESSRGRMCDDAFFAVQGS